MTYYDEIASGYIELHREEQFRKLKLIKERLNLGKNQLLLDVGCGPGYSLEFFKNKCFGVDPSVKLLKQAQGPVVCAVAEHLPFKDASFDAVISVTAIHNFTDIENGLAGMKKVGKDLFAFSVLKKSARVDKIRELVNNYFSIIDYIEEEQDLIFFCKKI